MAVEIVNWTGTAFAFAADADVSCERGSQMLLLVTLVDHVRLGFPIHFVDRVVPACEVLPLPRAPREVLGAVNLAGRVLGTFDLRQRLNLPRRPVAASDHFLVVTWGERCLALLVDEATGVEDYAADRVMAGNALGSPIDRHVSGLVRLDDGLLLIEDPRGFLEPRALDELDRALEASGSGD